MCEAADLVAEAVVEAVHFAEVSPGLRLGSNRLCFVTSAPAYKRTEFTARTENEPPGANKAILTALESNGYACLRHYDYPACPPNGSHVVVRVICRA